MRSFGQSVLFHAKSTAQLLKFMSESLVPGIHQSLHNLIAAAMKCVDFALDSVFFFSKAE
jgi:hypothetical protein